MQSIPQDFQRALKQNRLHGFFVECAFVHQAGYLSWILTSIRPVTRRRRIQQAVVRLQAQRAEVLAAARGPILAEILRPAMNIPSAELVRADERRSA
jgi:heme exporter protein D